MGLISRKAAIDKLNAIPSGNWSKTRYKRELWNVPSVPAVPLDKLCEWLAKFGCPCDINEDMCDQAHGVDRCIGIFNSNAFCWQYLLTKIMEEQDAVD